LVIELGRAMRTFAFKTFWWEIRLLGKIEVGQTVAYGGERESISTSSYKNHPERSLVDGTGGWNTRNGVLACKFNG
jgi:hypothetical protein